MFASYRELIFSFSFSLHIKSRHSLNWFKNCCSMVLSRYLPQLSNRLHTISMFWPLKSFRQTWRHSIIF